MKLRTFCLTATAVLLLGATARKVVTMAPAGENRSYLKNALHGKPVTWYIGNGEKWRETQRATLQRQITSLPDSAKKTLIKEAEEAMKFDWPAIPDTLYQEYKTTGNRNNFEKKMQWRRTNLSRLVIGALITGDDKYLPQIANGIQAICSEDTWILPAHAGMQKKGVHFADAREDVVDLNSAETAALLAATRFMLFNRFKTNRDTLNSQLAEEIKTRITIPYLRRNDLWWMGMQAQTVNNWNPWINSNVLYAMLYTEKDTAVLENVVTKIITSTDHFIDQYPADGGCDEGPGYWSVAGGRLIRLMALLNSASNGKLSWQHQPLIENMGTYIYKLHIAGKYFVNFADAQPKTIPNPESVYYFGKQSGNDTLIRFAAWLSRLNTKPAGSGNLVDFLQQAAIHEALEAATPAAPLPAVSWLPDLQVLTARSKAGSTDGLFFGAKGGNNGESHNHNDIGNFVLYAGGKPVIVDAGVGTYTARTFSKDRYDIWTMQSQWHNCPTVNGVMQKEGQQYKASEVAFSNKPPEVSLSMNLACAYPPEAAVKTWQRNFLFNGNRNQLTITDNYQLSEYRSATLIHFLTCAQVKETGPGLLLFSDDKGQPQLQLKYDAAGCVVNIERKELDDDATKASWGAALYRVTFTINNKNTVGKTAFVFAAVN